MKFSKFNIIKKKDNDIFIYNTDSGGVLHLDDEYAKNFELLQQTGDMSLGKEDLLENLKKGKMLVDDNFDEKTYAIMQNNLIRFSSNIFSLTIAPTMKCNFACPYCYEVNKEYTSMNEETINKLIELIAEAKENYDALDISWYGGEPLMALSAIKRITKAAIDIFGKEKYSASIVTNGYFLTEETAKLMKELKIYTMQITIDGPPDIHNKRRKLLTGEDTFFVIFNNMKKAYEVNDNLFINIRVNMDKENVERIDEILDYIKEYDLKDKVGLYLAPVDNINDTCNSSTCLSTAEFAEEQMNFINRNLKKGFNFAYLPQVNYGMCGAVASCSYVIDSLGNIYKCWDDVANTKKCAGTIFSSNPMANENISKWLAYSISDDPECMNCPFLPICMGGCPNVRIRGNKKKCQPIKENVDKMIETLFRIAQERKQR